MPLRRLLSVMGGLLLQACLHFYVALDDAFPGLPCLPECKAMAMQNAWSVIRKLLYSGTEETAATNPQKFAAGSVSLHHSLGCCTNICAGSWEWQGGSGKGRVGMGKAGWERE